ncbi:hypothetical protein EDD21DRAFT_393598 [Dissophora ornata]|nr:hypothetical protein EDD21DRAFT_393598 [Dissophora ornata]
MHGIAERARSNQSRGEGVFHFFSLLFVMLDWVSPILDLTSRTCTTNNKKEGIARRHTFWFENVFLGNMLFSLFFSARQTNGAKTQGRITSANGLLAAGGVGVGGQGETTRNLFEVVSLSLALFLILLSARCDPDPDPDPLVSYCLYFLKRVSCCSTSFQPPPLCCLVILHMYFCHYFILFSFSRTLFFTVNCSLS